VPPANTSWQIQLQGKIKTTFDVRLYDVDTSPASRSPPRTSSRTANLLSLNSLKKTPALKAPRRACR
jgi:hypothetical protein